MDNIDRLKKAIFDLHGEESTHTASINVHETFAGKTVWKGVVEVFSLIDHPTAKNAYAWSYENDTGKMRHIALLEVPPINSPADAVRASIIAESKSAKKGQ